MWESWQIRGQHRSRESFYSQYCFKIEQNQPINFEESFYTKKNIFCGKSLSLSVFVCLLGVIDKKKHNLLNYLGTSVIIFVSAFIIASRRLQNNLLHNNNCISSTMTAV
jgi:hypothetical protein